MKRVYVVGLGEVGGRLAGALETAGWAVARVTRNQGWETAVDLEEPSPRVVAVREEALADVLERIPTELRPHLVLVQNGFLEAVHHDLEPVSRGLIWFTSKGEFFRTLCPSLFHGPHASDLVNALAAGGLAVGTLDDHETFLREMIVKGIWNCVVGLPLAVHEVDLATYLRDRRAELSDLIDESARAAGAEYGVTVDTETTRDKILSTTTELGWIKGGAKALPWRNGAIAMFGRRHRVPTPVNDRLLDAVGWTHETDRDGSG